MKSVFLIFFTAFFIFSCDKESEQEKMVNAEFAAIQANWKISSFSIGGQIPDSVDFKFSDGNFSWGSCKFTDEGQYSQLCGGDITLNTFKGNLTYLYNIEEKTYQLDLLGSGSDQDKALRSLIKGIWTLEVTGNVMKATQIKNDSFAGSEIVFNANRL